ncbi:hypothetical protein K525DRAFT_194353 [Schizophyllum commune Loenen D]|nr:hypothetical protein K525DRAFT_194353 [Schizophyllum commune Loenen D]
MSSVDDIATQFAALAVTSGWQQNSSRYRRERRAFIADAVVTGFRTNFGSNEADLNAWRRLCTTVGVEGGEAFGSIGECKKALKGTFVNIVDLVDAANAGKTVSKTFNSANKLRAYSLTMGKIFPKKRAKSNPLLKFFLIVMF